ncbi:DUF3152 domain-containing protein [Streptomyces sp. TRM76323]|uniref:DUF3152 domain-containing protein n=1 Tax=Streptomyces tamarix TaxID=3078565 RepID=A0ABU3QDH8_9ACTN|nr:DUF3152 domain-containing protein [Streptomyces tamarix]MDT9680823.1 DUF3152 domain-containing protein [Streptomyces tamarix]
MGRHSRKGPAPTDQGADDRTTTAAASGGGRRRRAAPEAPPRQAAPRVPQAAPATPPHQAQQSPQAQQEPRAPRLQWTPHVPQAPAPQQYGYGYGFGTPSHGTPAPDVRGGHPEQHEAGGAWGTAPYTAAAPPPPPAPRSRVAQGPPRMPGPRREFVEAFDAPAAQAAQDARGGAVGTAGDHPAGTAGPQDSPADDGAGARAAGPGGSGAHDDRPDDARGDGAPRDDDRDEERDGDRDGARDDGRAGKGRTFTGIAAAAVVTVLAVVVAGQVGDARQRSGADRAADASDRDTAADAASRFERRAAPQTVPPRPVAPTYEELMARQFPFDPEMKGSGDFEAVPGVDEAPGKGRKIRYRVDVEKGLGLDGRLFAQAVQKTLNDDRSWAHGGAMTFERISTGQPDFVVTLASPGTTGVWCAKSGLDTTVDNVSCDSAATDRVMINAYRWAQGAETFGPKAMFAYRQMLINHEVGHRLGHNHRTCQTPGALAPVMQQQTKSLEIDGIKCRPNPWVYPGD